MQEDVVRLVFGVEPESVQVKNLVDKNIVESDLTRLEKLKLWIKENFLALSGVLIMSVTLITAIVALTRKAVRVGTKATSKVAKALAELGKS